MFYTFSRLYLLKHSSGSFCYWYQLFEGNAKHVHHVNCMAQEEAVYNSAYNMDGVP